MTNFRCFLIAAALLIMVLVSVPAAVAETRFCQFIDRHPFVNELMEAIPGIEPATEIVGALFFRRVRESKWVVASIGGTGLVHQFA